MKKIMFDNGMMLIFLALQDDLVVYVFFTLCILAAYYFIFKNFVKDIFDPLFLNLITCALSDVVPLYMFYKNLYYKDDWFYLHVVSQIAYIIGMLVFYKYANFKKSINQVREEGEIHKLKEAVFLIYAVIYVVMKLSEYLLVGIPLFSEQSRVYMFQGTNLGIISWISSSVLLPLIILILDSWIVHKKINLTKSMILFFIIISLFLSESKSSVFVIMYAIFFYKIYLMKFKDANLNWLLEKKRYLYRKTIVLGILGALIPLVVKLANGDFMEGLYQLGVRVVSFGDVYALFYTNNIVDYINHQNIFYGIFGTVLATFRIIPYSDLSEGLGLQITRTITGLIDSTWGPNIRHDCFGFIYLGAGITPLFSFATGWIIVFFCRYMYCKITGFNIFSFMIYCVIYSNIVIIATDWSYGMTSLIIEVLINISIFFLVYVVNKFLRKGVH